MTIAVACSSSQHLNTQHTDYTQALTFPTPLPKAVKQGGDLVFRLLPKAGEEGGAWEQG